MSHEKPTDTPARQITVPEIEANAYIEDIQEPPSDKPPDGGYGWVCIFACFMINGFTW